MGQTVMPVREFQYNGHLIEIGKTYSAVTPFDWDFHWRVDELHVSPDRPKVHDADTAIALAAKFVDKQFPIVGAENALP